MNYKPFFLFSLIAMIFSGKASLHNPNYLVLQDISAQNRVVAIASQELFDTMSFLSPMTSQKKGWLLGVLMYIALEQNKDIQKYYQYCSEKIPLFQTTFLLQNSGIHSDFGMTVLKGHVLQYSFSELGQITAYLMNGIDPKNMRLKSLLEPYLLSYQPESLEMFSFDLVKQLCSRVRKELVNDLVMQIQAMECLLSGHMTEQKKIWFLLVMTYLYLEQKKSVLPYLQFFYKVDALSDIVQDIEAAVGQSNNQLLHKLRGMIVFYEPCFFELISTYLIKGIVMPLISDSPLLQILRGYRKKYGGLVFNEVLDGFSIELVRQWIQIKGMEVANTHLYCMFMH